MYIDVLSTYYGAPWFETWLCCHCFVVHPKGRSMLPAINNINHSGKRTVEVVVLRVKGLTETDGKVGMHAKR